MAEISYPFDAGTGAIVTEDDWSAMAVNWQDDGVIATTIGGSELRAIASVEPNFVDLSAGSAVIQGFNYRNTDTLPLAFTTNGDVNPRIDRIVLRLDRTTNAISAVVKEGTPSVTPVAPAVNTVYPIYEMSLATYTVAAGASTATSVDNADRAYTSRFIRVAGNTTGHPTGSIVYNRADDKFYMVRTGDVVAEIGEPSVGGGGGATTLRKTTQQTLTGSTDLVADDGLTYAIPGTDDYLVEGVIFYQSNTAASSLLFSVAGATVSLPPNPKTRYLYQTSASIAPALSSDDVTPFNVTIGAVAANTVYTVEFNIVARFTSGTLRPQYTPQNAAHTWTIFNNSWMRITAL